MFISNLCKYSFIRLFLNYITKRQKYKNNEYLYTYYTSLLFQLFILPILNILYYYDKISYNYIIISGINYFLSDLPEIFYSKLYKYLFHHIISILMLYSSFYVPKEIKPNVTTNLLLLELGSSVLSFDIICNINYYKPYIFGSSRLLSIINGLYIIYKINNKYIKIILSILMPLLIKNNYRLLKYLIKKMHN